MVRLHFKTQPLWNKKLWTWLHRIFITMPGSLASNIWYGLNQKNEVSTSNSACSHYKSCLPKWSVDKVHKLPHTFVMCNVYYEKEVRHHYGTGSISNNHSQASILHWSQIQFQHFSFPSSAFATLNWVHNHWFSRW